MNKYDEKTLLSTPVFDVVEKSFDNAKFKPVGLNCKDWVMIIAMDTSPDPYVVTVKQTRWGLEDETLEFPCGTVELGEKPIEAAIREFREETGIDLPVNPLDPVISFNPNPAYFNNKMHVYLYREDDIVERYINRNKQNLDENEDCKVQIKRLSSCNNMQTHAMGIIGHNIAKKEARIV